MYNSLYPINVKPYTINRGFVKRKEDDEQSSNAKAQQQEALEQKRAEHQQVSNQYPRPQYPNGQSSAIDYSRSTVNIAQIVTDFKNTTAAIGAPDNIKSEVSAYLGLIEGESLKENPNGKIIHANLKTASQVLDNYIAATLNKPSDVVEKWIDALFLQKVDFHSDPTAINPEFQVQLPPKKEENQVVVETVQQQDSQFQTIATTYPTLPQNKEVKKAFIQGKKYCTINDTEKALSSFENALKLAIDNNDEQAKSMIFLEVAKIYDGHDLLPQALTLYNKAAVNTQDPNIKTKAYYAMGKIYDDAVQFHPAMEHYYASIAFAGESENLKTQTFSLVNIANMFAGKYNTSEAKNYFETAQQIAQENKNNKLSAKVFKLSASKMDTLNEPKVALDYYKQSSYYFNKDKNAIDLADNYEKSSALMAKLGNKNKAKTLLKKAQTIYTKNNLQEEAFNVEKQLYALK